MDTIVRAIPLENYRIEIVTSSGVEGIFDVKPYMKGSAFHELSEPAYFRQVRPAHHGIMWPHEQDISSDTIIHDIKESQRTDASDRCSARAP